MLITNSNSPKQLYFAKKLNLVREYKIYRWSKTIQSPYLEVFHIDNNHSGPMVLDDLIYIKDTLDSTLSFRRSCREGICGSCAMNINGENTLACLEEVSGNSTLHVLPLPHLKVIKDLIPDLTHFFDQYQSIKPWLIGNPLKKTDEILQHKTNRILLDNLYECILCACCTTSCPSYWWNSSSYLGPSVLLQAFRWIIDSRDTTLINRLLNLYHPFKLFKCHQILNCTKVCPKHLDPALAIQKIKAQMYSVLEQLH